MLPFDEAWPGSVIHRRSDTLLTGAFGPVSRPENCSSHVLDPHPAGPCAEQDNKNTSCHSSPENIAFGAATLQDQRIDGHSEYQAEPDFNQRLHCLASGLKQRRGPDDVTPNSIDGARRNQNGDGGQTGPQKLVGGQARYEEFIQAADKCVECHNGKCIGVTVAISGYAVFEIANIDKHIKPCSGKMRSIQFDHLSPNEGLVVFATLRSSRRDCVDHLVTV